MASPMQKRQWRIKAEQAEQKAVKDSAVSMQNKNVTVESNVPQNEWELVRSTIEQDLRELKRIKPQLLKIEYKDKVLANYLPYLERENVPTDIKMRLMVWLFDTGNLSKALPIAIEATELGLSMPEGFKSSAPEFIADTVYKWTEKEFKRGASVEPFFTQVFKLVTEKWQTYEQITAKYYKLAGLMALGKANTKIKHVSEPENLRIALNCFIKADAIYDKAGVSVRITEIKSRLALLFEDV